MPQQQPQQQMTPEQLEALKEKLKNMSPEELREFQKKQCIFCHIIAGKVQAKKIYEDSSCLGVLDINPANPGHILLMPKEHYTVMPQVPEDEIGRLFIVSKQLSNAVLRSIEAKGTNIIVANGPAAGQKAQHFMIHIIPRKEKDGIKFELPQRTIPEDQLDKLSKEISKRLGHKQEEPSPAEVLQQKIAVPEKKPEKKIVEAEFKEEPKKQEAKQEEKPKPEKKKVAKKAKAKKGKGKKEEISLDDVARLLENAKG